MQRGPVSTVPGEAAGRMAEVDPEMCTMNYIKYSLEMA